MIDREQLKREMLLYMKPEGLVYTAEVIGIHHQTLSKLLYTENPLYLKSLVKIYQWVEKEKIDWFNEFEG